ncbi:TolC family protein [Labilibacter marinus]|uniref:TolC family protein n=1 Tax=Labilibacter marinus TaxID=1477105 RepID=UPI0009FAB2FE|nr:TolC family protein [Labilibacter marinus]
MTTKMRILIITLLMCCSLITKAQNDTLEVSMNQAMAYATEFGYQSINARTDIEIAKRKVRETLAIGLPQVNASGFLNSNLRIQENQIQFGDTTTIRTKFGTKLNSSIGGRVDQLLFDGSYLVGLQASKVYVQLSENAKQKTDIQIKEAVANAYFLVLLARANIDEFKANYEVINKTLKDTKIYYENGLVEETDVDQVRLMEIETRRLYSNAQRQLEIAMAVLKFSMGVDIDNGIRLSDKISDILLTIPNDPSSTTNIQSHIDYRILATQIDIQGLDIKNQKAQAMPKLNAFANYDYSWFGDEFSQLVNTDAAAIGVSLNIPIFSSGMRSSQLKQKKLELKKLEVDRQMLEQDLRMTVLVASTNLSNAKEEFESAIESKNISSKIYDKSLIKFKNGLLNSLDLSQVEGRKVEAIINASRAASTYFDNYIIYQKATSQL